MRFLPMGLVGAVFVASMILCGGRVTAAPVKQDRAAAQKKTGGWGKVGRAISRGIRSVFRVKTPTKKVLKPSQGIKTPAKKVPPPATTKPLTTNDPLRSAINGQLRTTSTTKTVAKPLTSKEKSSTSSAERSGEGKDTGQVSRDKKASGQPTKEKGSADKGAKSAEVLRVETICRKFAEDRKSLDNDKSIEWVEGWHGVRAHNVRDGVPGIVKDQGLWVSKSVSFMPEAAYWHPNRPDTPQQWTNSGAMVHFRVPKAYLEKQGKWVQDRSAGNRFKHEDSGYPPHSKVNPNIEIMPIQVLEVYWVRGDIPQKAAHIGVDLRNQTTWPQTKPK